MSEFQDGIEKQMENLRRVRDELEVQLNLAGKEASDLWERLEKDWQHLEGRVKVVFEESETVAEDVGSTLSQAAEQLKEGYQRIKKLL